MGAAVKLVTIAVFALASTSLVLSFSVKRNRSVVQDGNDAGFDVKKFGNVLEEPAIDPASLNQDSNSTTTFVTPQFVDQFRIKPEPIHLEQKPTSDLDLVDEEDGNGSLVLTEIKVDGSSL